MRMSKFQNVLVLLIGFSIFTFMSCSDDDNGNGNGNGDGNGNYVELKGKKYPLAKSNYQEQMVGNVDYVIIGFTNEELPPQSLFFTFWYHKFADLPSGTYTMEDFLTDDGDYNPNYDADSNFGDASFYRNEEEDNGSIDFTDGSITLSKTNNSIKVDFEGDTALGTIKGHYEGSISDFLQ